jgi:hypothetical protein
MLTIYDRLRNEPVLVIAVLGACVDALVNGLGWRQALTLGLATLARHFVTPSHDVIWDPFPAAEDDDDE